MFHSTAVNQSHSLGHGDYSLIPLLSSGNATPGEDEKFPKSLAWEGHGTVKPRLLELVTAAQRLH